MFTHNTKINIRLKTGQWIIIYKIFFNVWAHCKEKIFYRLLKPINLRKTEIKKINKIKK